MQEIKKEILESTDCTSEQKAAAKSIKKDFAKVAWKKGVQDEVELFPELDVLHDYLLLFEAEAELKGCVKEKEQALFERLVAQYAKLTEAEIKTLIVDDKWLAQLAADVQSELDRVSQALTGRIRQLADRYAAPLPNLTEEVETLAARVDGHLRKMGAVWN